MRLMGGTIDFDERPEYPKEQGYPDRFEATRKVRCDFDNRLTLAREFLGWTDEGGTIHPAHKYDKDDANFGPAYVASFSIEPIMGIDPLDGGYKYADLTVNYSTATTLDANNISITESVNGASEFLTIGNAELYWTSAHTADVKIDTSEYPTKLVRMLEWSYTKHRQLSIPSSVFSKMGYVNSSAISSSHLGYTFAAETLLFGNPSCARTIGSNQIDYWEITYTFMYRPNGWNKFPRSTTGAWSYIYDATGAQVKPYSSISFSDLVI